MIRITADVFSGRPNPSWFVEDDDEVQATLREFVKLPKPDASASSDLGKLGQLRGFHLNLENDELAGDHGLSTSLYLHYGESAVGSPVHGLAERLIALASDEGLKSASHLDGQDTSQVIGAADLRGFLTQQLDRRGGVTVSDTNDEADPEASEDARALASITCQIELGAYNPGFWNNDSTIRSTNNCYNYASNKRTNTFAQPGRGSGHIYTAISCPAVSAAALADGLHRRFVCFPAREKPRYLVALVVAPGPSFNDFHWYRKNKEGFWSHKPGGTAVRNVDNSGHVISDPATCDRGPYTHFCGYFYTCRSQRIA